MKKVFLAVVTLMVLVAGSAFAQEKDSDRISTLADFRINYIDQKEGDDQFAQDLMVWWQYKKLGMVIEESYLNKNRTTCFKGALLWKLGKSWYPLLGLATNNGSEFVQTGLWYINSFGKANVLLDTRVYWSITGSNNGYTDNLLRIMYPIGNGFSAGVDFSYDHWWSGPAHNWYFVGPRLSYAINSNISVYTRVSHEWDVREDAGTNTAIRYRIGLVFNF